MYHILPSCNCLALKLLSSARTPSLAPPAIQCSLVGVMGPRGLNSRTSFLFLLPLHSNAEMSPCRSPGSSIRVMARFVSLFMVASSRLRRNWSYISSQDGFHSPFSRTSLLALWLLCCCRGHTFSTVSPQSLLHRSILCCLYFSRNSASTTKSNLSLSTASNCLIKS